MKNRKNSASCGFCDERIYIKVIQISRPILAPASEIGVLREKLQDKTGMAYIMLPRKYCPMCGAKLTEKGG